MATTDSWGDRVVPTSGDVPVDLTLALELLRRDELAVRWCEAVAHRGNGVARLLELVAAEERIAQLWPAYWRRNSHRILMRDVPLIHSSERPIAQCPTCHASRPGPAAEAA